MTRLCGLFMATALGVVGMATAACESKHGSSSATQSEDTTPPDAALQSDAATRPSDTVTETSAPSSPSRTFNSGTHETVPTDLTPSVGLDASAGEPDVSSVSSDTATVHTEIPSEATRQTTNSVEDPTHSGSESRPPTTTESTSGATDVTSPSTSEPPFEPCNVQAPTACLDPAPKWAQDIEPIVEQRCVVCHYGAVGGPWPLDSYGHVSDWQSEIRGVILDCSMPPPDEDIHMTNAERMQILNWIRCGLPQ